MPVQLVGREVGRLLKKEKGRRKIPFVRLSVCLS